MRLLALLALCVVLLCGCPAEPRNEPVTADPELTVEPEPSAVEPEPSVVEPEEAPEPAPPPVAAEPDPDPQPCTTHPEVLMTKRKVHVRHGEFDYEAVEPYTQAFQSTFPNSDGLRYSGSCDPRGDDGRRWVCSSCSQARRAWLKAHAEEIPQPQRQDLLVDLQ